MILVAEGNQLSELGQYDVKEGEVRIYLDRDLTMDELVQIQNMLPDDIVRYDARILDIKFQNGLGVIAGLNITGVIGWQLFEGEYTFLLPLGLLGLFVLLLSKKQGKNIYVDRV